MRQLATLLLIMTILWNTPLKGQEIIIPPALGISPFYSGDKDNLNLSQDLYEAVTRRLVQSKQFRIIDIPKRANAEAEIETMKRREFIEQEIIHAGNSTPAEFLLIGFVRNTEVFYIDSNNAQVRVDFEVKYIDVKSGETLQAQSFTGSSYSNTDIGLELGMDIGKKLLNDGQDLMTSLNDKLEASVSGKMIDAVDNSADAVFKWVMNTSHSSFYFLKVADEVSSRKIRSIIIEGGRNVGLEKGLKLMMILDEELTGIRGNRILNEQPVATLRITEVRAETSVCKVLREDKDIDKYLEDENLRIIFTLN